MKTEDILLKYHKELFNFILKKVNNEFIAEEVFQNSFIKIHQGISQLNDKLRVRAWSYAIVRNEIINAINQHKSYDIEELGENIFDISDNIDVCCLSNFISKLPDIYKTVVNEVYIEGKSQKKVAIENGISLPNVKARLRRAKSILINSFIECCKYEIDSKGKLKGESHCQVCNVVNSQPSL